MYSFRPSNLKSALYKTLGLLCLMSIFLIGKVQAQPFEVLVKQGIDSLSHSHYLSSLQIFIKAEALAEKDGNKDHLFFAKNNMGLAYLRLGDAENAIHYLLQAYSIAIENKATTDEMTALNNIAILYAQEKDFAKAEEYFSKALSTAERLKITSRIGLFALNLAELRIEQQDANGAKPFLQKAQEPLRNLQRYRFIADIAWAKINLLEAQPELAISAAIPLLDTAKRLNAIEETCELHLILAKAYWQKNQLDLAKQHTQDALQSGSADMDLRLKAWRIRSDIFAKAGDFTQALASRDSIVALKDTLYNTKNRQRYHNSKLRFELQNSQHQLSVLEAASEWQRQVFLIVALFIVVVGGLAIWLFRLWRQRLKQNQSMIEDKLKIATLEIEREKQAKLLLEKQNKAQEMASLLEQERLRNEVELRNRQLSEKILFQSSRNSLIEEIIESLSASKHLPSDSPALRQIRQLKQHLQEDTEWDEFSETFESVHPQFGRSLLNKHPDLTPSDIRFAAFVFMNLSNKEMASLLNITPESCRKRKERLSKKLNIPEDLSLSGYLASL